MQTLSVVIIAKNEAHNIAECIRSANFANEVIVLDSGSTDGTVEIARAEGARVIETDWPGFGVQKNRALDAAKCDWIYSLDADERITTELASEIKSMLASAAEVNNPVAYRAPRLSQFCGQFMRHSGWWPDYTVRLVKRGCGRFSELQVHESLQVVGEVGTLKSHMLHYSYRNFEDVLNKLNQYSSAGARDKQTADQRDSFSSAILHGIAAFVRSYVFRLGLLDGKLGFALAVYAAESSYYKYLKYWYKSNSSA